jgi:hypothetical protein
MDSESYRLMAYYVVVGLSAGFNAKFLGVCIVFAVALLTSVSTGGADFLMIFFVPALLLAGFRG